MLQVGDKIICNVKWEQVTYGKKYMVTQTRTLPERDICIRDDNGNNWWFGQIGSTECWTRWFITELEWERNKKLEQIL